MCLCSLLPPLALLLSFLGHPALPPRAGGVPQGSALNLVSRMSPCGAHDTHACCARSNEHLLYLRVEFLLKTDSGYPKDTGVNFFFFVMIELMIQVFIEVRITYLSQHNQLPAVFLMGTVALYRVCSTGLR